MNHLKSKGQMQCTMAKLNNWIEENRDKLYMNMNLRNTYGSLSPEKQKSRDIMRLVSMRSDVVQKRIFHMNLLSKAEDMLIKRRNRIR